MHFVNPRNYSTNRNNISENPLFYAWLNTWHKGFSFILFLFVLPFHGFQSESWEFLADMFLSSLFTLTLNLAFVTYSEYFNANANGIPRTSTPWQYLMVLIRKFQSTLKRYIRKTQYTRKRWRNFQLSGILCRNEMFACIFIFESYCLMHQRCFKKWNCESLWTTVKFRCIFLFNFMERYPLRKT